MGTGRTQARLNDKKEIDMPQMTVVCPHCGSTGTYTHGFASGSGSTRAQCKSCHKSFTVEIRNGQVHQVRK